MSGSWQAFEDGSTIGTTGSEGGTILRDEEHGLGARITLERGGAIGPYAITCGIYGFMVHTTWAAERAEAETKFTAMKSELASLLKKGSPDEVYEFIDRY